MSRKILSSEDAITQPGLVRFRSETLAEVSKAWFRNVSYSDFDLSSLVKEDAHRQYKLMCVKGESCWRPEGILDHR